MSNLKDTLTTIFAYLVVIGTAVNAYLQSLPPDGTINWFQLVIGVVTAVIAYLTGKNGDGTKKKVPTKV